MHKRRGIFAVVLAVGAILPFFTSDADVSPARVARRSLQKTEVLGLLIFIVMAAVMFAVGAGLFCDWLAEPGSAPVGTPADPDPVAGDLRIAGAIPVVPLVVGVEVLGALSLTVLYLLSGLRRGV